MKKPYMSQTFLKMADERMHISHFTPLAISFKKHQKSSPYFSHHQVPLVLLFFAKMQNQKGGPWPNAP